jgi:hypothetical protein
MSTIERREEISSIYVLLPFFIGSPPDLKQNYQEAMAIIAKLENQLYLRLTRNGKWREISAEIPNYLTPSDPLNVVTKVYNS